MPVLSARNLTKAFGASKLFDGLNITITRGERVGLLGINGTGKSTLLKVLAGLEPTDEGIIERRRDATILYLDQEPKPDPELTPRQWVQEGLSEWDEATKAHAKVSLEIEQGHADAERLQLQSDLAEKVDHLGGWARGHEVEDFLHKLGIREIDSPLGRMSGGERRRAALARILVARPMLAILDEPTNHLDTDTIDWLEDFLTSDYKGAILMVTHDRYVLDALCDRTLELDRGNVVSYQGGYADFLDQKAERLEHEDRVESNRLNLVRRETAWLRRGAKARSTKQKARIQRAEAVIADVPTKAKEAVDLAGLGVTAPKMGGTILDFLDIDLAVGEGADRKQLVKGFTHHVVRGDRIGIVGPNGAGKTSLLKAVMGELAPTRGKLVVGDKTKIALFDQARANLIDDWNILDNVAELEGASMRGAGYVTIGKETMEMRSYLENFHFDASKQRQKVGSLSGGERARVALAKVLKSGSNMLLLDEPTNDLDTMTLSSLEELLENWPGALLVVSHDRYFLDRVATRILAFEGDGLVVPYAGNYSNYRAMRPPKVSAKSSNSKPPPKPTVSEPPPPLKAKVAAKKALTFAEQKELDGLLDKISAAEEAQSFIEARLADPDLYAKASADVANLQADLAKAQGDATRLMARWEELESKRAGG